MPLSLFALFVSVAVANAFPVWKTITTEKGNIHLVRVSIEDLGFEYNPTYIEINARAIDLGLQSGSEKIANELRGQYKDQQAGEHLYVMTNPVNGKFKVYDLYRSEKRIDEPYSTLHSDDETKDFLDDYKYDYKSVGEHYFVFVTK